MLISNCTAHNHDDAGDVGNVDDEDNDHDNDNDEDHSNDDWIKLEGGGIVSYWQLPANLKRCPVNVCPKVFENNSAVKEHYRLMHAKYAILCEPCGWPVMVKGKISTFLKHFQKYHPNVKQPYDFGKMVEPENNVKQV